MEKADGKCNHQNGWDGDCMETVWRGVSFYGDLMGELVWRLFGALMEKTQ